MKICSKCKAEKPLTEFGKQSDTADGLKANCKTCRAAYNAANRDKLAAYNAAYYAANRESVMAAAARCREASPDKCAAYQEAYQAANRERLAAYKAAYYESNREKIAVTRAAYQAENRERIAAYRAENPEKFAAYRRNRRARKRNAEGSHTAADVRAIFESQRGLCANCQTKLFKSGKHKFHADHIAPLSKGGSNDKYNLQCLCPSCNLSKGAKHPDAWAKQQGKLL